MEELTSSSGDIEQGGHAGIEVVGGAALHQPDTCLVQHCVLLVHAPRDELQRLLSLALHMQMLLPQSSHDALSMIASMRLSAYLAVHWSSRV